MYQLFVNFIRDPKLYQYLAVGAASATVDISLFLLLNRYFEYHYLMLATASFFVATLFNYALCQLFVFKHQTKHCLRTRLLLTYTVSGVGLSIHHFFLFTCFEFFALPLFFSKLVAMGVAFAWNFLSRKYIVFTPSRA